MKNIFKYTLAAVLGLSLITGCETFEDFGDTNTNPAATTDPITSALLTNVLSGIGGYASNSTYRPALYCQYLSETQYTDASLYSSNKADIPSYAGMLMDLQNIINYNTDEATKNLVLTNGSNANQVAVATILKSYIFWIITDRYGDIPYTGVLTGSTEITYDKQEVVYKGIIVDLKAAVDLFDGGAPVKGDIVFNGDAAKWKKTANSLRMLMALRLSKRYAGPSDYAATEFKAALAHAAGSVESNSDNFVINYAGGTFKFPYYAMYDGRKDFGESETMTTLMGDLNDGRQAAFGSSNVGVPYGWTRAKAEAWTGNNANWAKVLADSYRPDNGSLLVVGAAQVLLARAEAADRGWTTENVQAKYEAGIKASFAQWKVATPPANYFTNAKVALGATGTGANLKQIATQRYIATYPDGMQGWSEWRRTGFPELTPAVDAVNSSKKIPRRFVYGNNEYNLTGEALESAIASLEGGDTMDAKIWWDK
jgi:hypothetical protein